MAFNRKQRLRDNIEAIRTAFLLDREQRTPTARERLLLERYCGFGGLKCILNPARELTDAVHWAKSDLELFAPTVELHMLLRTYLLIGSYRKSRIERRIFLSSRHKRNSPTGR